MLLRESPIRKCPGVKVDRSLGTVEMGVNGREFNIASISVVNVSKFP